MAREIEPILVRGEDPSRVEPIIHYMMVMNPAVEIYLLDSDGAVLAFFAQPGKQVRQERVDTEPIEAFLLQARDFPIYGDDPRHPGQRKHFSAARIPLGEGGTGYLYIVLRSSLYETAESLLQRGFLFAALRDSLIIALPVVGLLGLALFFFSTRRLERLTRTVRAFGAGDYSRRAEAASRDEIGELAGAFNRMADTIVSNVDRIREADRERRELIANISHDLRNPLASIQGYLETLALREGSISEEDRRQYLSVAQNGTAVLRRLIEQLFELSKLDSAEARPRMERFSLGELVQDVVMQLQPEADRSGVALSVLAARGAVLRRGGHRDDRAPAHQPDRQRDPAHPGRRERFASSSISGTAAPAFSSGIPAAVFPPMISCGFSTASTSATAAARVPAPAAGSAWPSRNGSSTCTTAVSAPRAPRAREAPSGSICRGRGEGVGKLKEGSGFPLSRSCASSQWTELSITFSTLMSSRVLITWSISSWSLTNPSCGPSSRWFLSMIG